MVTLEPSIALSTCENALRRLMSHVYPSAYGAGWIEKVTTEVQRKAWPERVEAEVNGRGRRGVAETDGLGLTYANMYDLIEIAKKHWDPLSPALNKKAGTLPLLERFEQLRNPTAHSRTLLTFERELLSGIAGQIRNQVTLYMSSRDEVGNYYPRIEAVLDCFGHRLDGQDRPTGEIFDSQNTDTVLRPGDRVQFTATGFDVHDRPLVWTLHLPRGRQESTESAPGSAAELQWRVEDGDVGETVTVEIFMSAKDSKYQRFNNFDHRAYFTYVVRPPLDHNPAPRP